MRRIWLPAVLAAPLVGLVSHAPAPPACVLEAAEVERAWGGTGAWRRLAPYPVPREVSPTDSVGVWLERWQLADGTVELRRVTAGETRVATLAGPGCDARPTSHVRTFDPGAMAGAFTDERLRDLLRTSRRGMIYVWSPGMPLSVRGLADARATAHALGIDLTTVVADADAAGVAASNSTAADRLTLDALELVYRDATLHYPSVLFYRDGALLGAAIPGYKGRETWEALARERLAAPTDDGVPAPAGPTPALWVDRDARVTTLAMIRALRPVDFFFKPVAKTDLIAYTSNKASYLFDLSNGAERRIPGQVDPVPTPDGRFLTRPGLIFHPFSSLLAGDTTPVFVDPALPDEYQTTSVLATSPTSARYRVTTGWHMSVRLREYDIMFDRAGKLTAIRPVGAPVVPCAGRSFSLPISAKSGREIGVYDTRSRTNRIIELADDGTCVDRLDLGFASGKLAFSFDGSAVAFATSRIGVDAEGALLKPSQILYKDALVLYRKTGRVVSVTRNRPIAGITFPEFLPDGRVIVLDKANPQRPVEVFRVVDVK